MKLCYFEEETVTNLKRNCEQYYKLLKETTEIV